MPTAAATSSSDSGEGRKKSQKKEGEGEEPSCKSKEVVVAEERAGGKSDGNRRGKANRQKASAKSQADSGIYGM